MWNPFKARRDHELRLASIQLQAAQIQADSILSLGQSQSAALVKISEMVVALSSEQGKSTGLLQTWLEGFKVYEQPVSTTIRDEDEVRMARERVLADVSLPAGLPPEFAALFPSRD